MKNFLSEKNKPLFVDNKNKCYISNNNNKKYLIVFLIAFSCFDEILHRFESCKLSFRKRLKYINIEQTKQNKN